MALGFRVQGSGFRVQGSGFRVQGSEFRVQGSGFRVQGPLGPLGSSSSQHRRTLELILQEGSAFFQASNPRSERTGSGFSLQGSWFRIQGSGFRVQGSGFKGQGSGLKVAV